MTVRLLLIDDDARLFELLDRYLGAQGLTVCHAPDGPHGLARLAEDVFDVVLLDMMMPGMDGLEVQRRIRAERTLPVLMLTAKGDETDRVVGLELGADDYISKPFGPRELLARIRAVLRRSQPEVISSKVAVGALVADVDARVARLDDRTLDLTGLEFDILVALMRRPGRVVPRDSLLSEAGRTDVVVGERTVDVHISHLRQKMADDSRAPAWIKTVRGVGYVLAKPDE